MWAPRCPTLLGAASSDSTGLPLMESLAGSNFDDPLESVRQRRRFGTDEPETWEPMPGADCAEVQLFSADPSAASLCIAVAAECAVVLAKTFKPCFGPEPPSSVPGLVEAIADSSNYEVLSITRLQNLARYSMHKHFGRSYGIASVRQVYHGTARANASTIAKVGFRNAASQRAKFGKGIYAASSVWEALAYAEPEAHSNVQTFLVADLLQGPTRVGHENMVDFGLDLSNKQILTTTNPDETIFCAAYEDQLYAHYSITVRFRFERTHSPSAHNIVRLYHPSIWSLIKAQTSQPPLIRKPVFAVPLPSPQAKSEELNCHMSFKGGDTVKIIKTLKTHTFCRGEVGRIKKIVKDGHVHFCVEFDSPDLQERIKLANKKQVYEWQTDLTWLRCQISHIETVTAPCSAPTPACTAPGSLGNSATLSGVASSDAEQFANPHDSSSDTNDAQSGSKRKRECEDQAGEPPKSKP